MTSSNSIKVSLLLVLVNLIYAKTITISTKLGPIKGAILESDHGKTFWAFRGIPYAKPPVKNLRFKAPEAVTPWTETLDATEDATECIQINVFNNSPLPDYKGDEDCLFLNIYTPQLSNGELLPIMVYFHGGGYISGAAASYLYGPQRFMDKGVILVTVNYRLGPFGFLSTGDEASPGNYGLLDQNFALKWIQENIIDFGGDANKVTIFGQSAGGASVSFHILSPLSKGLFHAAIQQSGNALNEWSIELEDPLPTAVRYGKLLHCPTSSSTALIECLRKKPALSLTTKTFDYFSFQLQNQKNPFFFRPTVDRVNGANAIIPRAPKELLLSGDINAVPIITGSTSDEAVQMLFMMAPAYGGIDKMNRRLMKTVLKLLSSKKSAEILEKIEDAYYQNVDESDFKQRIKAMSDLITDDANKPNDDFSIIAAKRGISVYKYKFSYSGSQTWIQGTPEYAKLPKTVASDLKLIGHIDDVQYLFRCGYFPSTELTKNDSKVAEIILNLWTNFAKTKTPTVNPDGSPDQVSWVPFDPDHPKYLKIELNPEIIDGYLCSKYSLWDEVENIRNQKTEL